MTSASCPLEADENSTSSLKKDTCQYVCVFEALITALRAAHAPAGEVKCYHLPSMYGSLLPPEPHIPVHDCRSRS